MILKIIHWIAFSYYAYLFGYASLFKVFKEKGMMESMVHLGYNETWTIMIGLAELLGWILLMIGIFNHKLKNIAVIWLFLFAVGALTAHFSHQDYTYYYAALFGCITAVVLLFTDKHFKISL